MFVTCKFHERDTRTYTYTCDIDVAPGDKVIVLTRDGEKHVTIVDVGVDQPPFACKPVLRKAEPKHEPEADEQGDML